MPLHDSQKGGHSFVRKSAGSGTVIMLHCKETTLENVGMSVSLPLLIGASLAVLILLGLALGLD